MTRAGPEPATEVRAYGGVRVGQGGKRVHAWLNASGEELLFSRAGAPMAVGSQYTVSGSRWTRPSHCTAPSAYAGSAADEATRRAVWAERTVAETRLEMIRAERNAARRSALDEAMARCWNWPARCAPAPSGTPSPLTSCASRFSKSPAASGALPDPSAARQPHDPSSS